MCVHCVYVSSVGVCGQNAHIHTIYIAHTPHTYIICLCACVCVFVFVFAVVCVCREGGRKGDVMVSQTISPWWNINTHVRTSMFVTSSLVSRSFFKPVATRSLELTSCLYSE